MEQERIRRNVLIKETQTTWTPRRKTLYKRLLQYAKVDSKDSVLDEKTKAEVQTRVAIHIHPEEREDLFKQEGVTRYQYINPTILHRIKDFLKI